MQAINVNYQIKIIHVSHAFEESYYFSKIPTMQQFKDFLSVFSKGAIPQLKDTYSYILERLDNFQMPELETSAVQSVMLSDICLLSLHRVLIWDIENYLKDVVLGI